MKLQDEYCTLFATIEQQERYEAQAMVRLFGRHGKRSAQRVWGLVREIDDTHPVLDLAAVNYRFERSF